MRVKLGCAQHKIRAHSANVGAIQQQIQLRGLGKFGIRFKRQ